jgi:hypothetical protein
MQQESLLRMVRQTLAGQGAAALELSVFSGLGGFFLAS